MCKKSRLQRLTNARVNASCALKSFGRPIDDLSASDGLALATTTTAYYRRRFDRLLPKPKDRLHDVFTYESDWSRVVVNRTWRVIQPPPLDRGRMLAKNTCSRITLSSLLIMYNASGLIYFIVPLNISARWL